MTQGSERITVLHVLPSILSQAGTPRKLLSLVKFSDQDAFRHVFLLFCNHEDNLSEAIRQSGGIVEEVNRPRNYDIRLLFDILRMIRRYKVDIVNTHFPRSDIMGLIAGRLLGKPVIKSVHGILWSESKLLAFLDRLLAGLRYLTVCNSQAAAEAEKARSHVKKLKIIHNGVIPRSHHDGENSRNEYRQRIGVPGKALLIGHVGGLIELREQHRIIDATAILREKGLDVYCAIAGNGPEEKRLKDRVRSLGIEDRVKFLDYIDTVDEFLASIDVYVNMARSEGFGIAVVEAMFAGVPVVLSDAGAHPELIIDGESGILVPHGGSVELADVIYRLCKDSSLRQRLSEHGEKRAIEQFAIQRFVHDFEDVYQQCVKSCKIR